MRYIAILILSVAMYCLSGCSPKVVPIGNATHDTVYVSRTEYQNIVLKDSVFISEKVKGDTVYLDRYKQVIAWRDRDVYDTLCISRTDTVTVKVVEYRQTMRQEIFGGLGRLFVWLAGGLLLYLVFAWIVNSTRNNDPP